MIRIVFLFSMLLNFNNIPPRIVSYSGEAHIVLDVMHQDKKVATIDISTEITLYGEQTKNNIFTPKYSKIKRIDSRNLTVKYYAKNYFVSNCKLTFDKNTQFISITANLDYQTEDGKLLSAFTNGYACLRFNQDSLMTFKIMSESSSLLKFNRFCGTSKYWNVQYQ